MRRQLICIDFDGVIADKEMNPIPGAFDTIARIRLRGYDTMILSARPAQQIKEWLLQHWPFQAPYGEPPLVTNVKPSAIAYIDDHAIRFHDWEDAWTQLRKYVFNKK